jgi:hypothetical protein
MHHAPCTSTGEHDNDKRVMVRQVAGLDRHYHGGLQAYIRNAKKLLSESKEGGWPGAGALVQCAVQGHLLAGVQRAVMHLWSRGRLAGSA